jgi:hypothetical protein
MKLRTTAAAAVVVGALGAVIPGTASAQYAPTPPGTPPAVVPVVPTPPVGGAGVVVDQRFPAKLRLRRANVTESGRLDLLVEITTRATGNVRASFRANGRTTTFNIPITSTGVMRVDRSLPAAMRRGRSGILELSYAGNARVRPDSLRARAAVVKANLRRATTTLENGRLRVAGTINSRAEGVVRIRLEYLDTDGAYKFRFFNVRINNNRWSLDTQLTGAQANGGQLSIQFTGYLPQRMRGEQTAKQVLPS